MHPVLMLFSPPAPSVPFLFSFSFSFHFFHFSSSVLLQSHNNFNHTTRSTQQDLTIKIINLQHRVHKIHKLQSSSIIGFNRKNHEQILKSQHKSQTDSKSQNTTSGRPHAGRPGRAPAPAWPPGGRAGLHQGWPRPLEVEPPRLQSRPDAPSRAPPPACRPPVERAPP